MSNSNIPLSLTAPKGLSSSNQLSSSFQSSGVNNAPVGDRQKRSGFNPGVASASRSNTPTPRANQSLRKQNKTSKRPKLYEDMAEAAAIRTSSRKGQTNITHLMNFTLPPRPYDHSHHGYARRGSHLSRRTNHSWGYNAIDKARYIHANYRFIVHPEGNYDHLLSVDDHVEWKDVLQVLASSQSQKSSCPICLSDPVSPRMAKCGHIFCLSCLIRYMHSADENAPMPEKKIRWKKCPICEDSIYISEARPVRWFVGQEGEPPREGHDVVLRLMKRDHDSALALPREVTDTMTVEQYIPWYFNPEVMDYARIMKGSTDYMQTQYDREIADVETLEKEDELMYGDETLWTQKAIASIRDAKEKAKLIGNPPDRPPARASDKSSSSATRSSINANQPNFTEANMKEDQSIVGGQESSLVSAHHNVSAISTSLKQYSQRTLETGRQSQVPNNHENSVTTFFFYQALLHYYLSPLDIRILRAEFADFSMFPSAVLARVEHISTGHIVDDDLRKRAKYLGHLPHGCEVAFLECDWTDIVSCDVLSKFSADLDRRRKRNKDKEMREEKERARAEKAEDDKRLTTIRRRRDSSSHGFSSRAPVSIPGSSAESRVLDLGSSASPPWTQSRAGFSSLASPSSSPNGQRTVWGTALIAPSEGSPVMSASTAVEPENDGWLLDWERDLIRDEDVNAQLQAMSLNDGITTPGHMSKKRKQKKITLMSTNARRAA